MTSVWYAPPPRVLTRDLQLTWRVAERIWVFEEPQKTVLDVIAEPNDAYNHLVIVDEAQNLYTCSPKEVQGCHSWESAPYPLSLWARIKEVSSLPSRVAYKVRFLVLAAYGTVRFTVKRFALTQLRSTGVWAVL